MSSQLRDLSAVADVDDTSREVEEGAGGPGQHPRGAGFRVLSRLARQVDQESDYAPRHRLAVPDEPDEPDVPDAADVAG